MLSPSSAQSPNCSCSLHYPSPTAPSRWCRSTPPPPHSDLLPSAPPDTSQKPSPSVTAAWPPPPGQRRFPALPPTTTTFRSPAVCAAGYVTETVAVGDCGVAAATWAKAIATAGL